MSLHFLVEFDSFLLTCDEMLSLLVFPLTLARAPFSPDDFSVTSRAALSSRGVSGRAGAAEWGRSLFSSLGSGFFPLFSIFLRFGSKLLVTRRQKRKRSRTKTQAKDSSVQPGLLAEELLRIGVVHQDLVQVFFVQDEEICKAVSDDVGGAPVAPPHCQQAANHRHVGWESDRIRTPTVFLYENMIFFLLSATSLHP